MVKHDSIFVIIKCVKIRQLVVYCVIKLSKLDDFLQIVLMCEDMTVQCCILSVNCPNLNTFLQIVAFLSFMDCQLIIIMNCHSCETLCVPYVAFQGDAHCFVK